MSNKLTINTRVRRLIHYITDIENGLIQIPEFQRDFVWDARQILDLLDSLKNNYPIGSILFWRPEEEDFGLTKKMGIYILPKQAEGFFYILDGFQRLTSIFNCLTSPDKSKLEKEGNWSDNKKFKIYYDLENEEFFVQRSGKLEAHQVSVYNLIDTRATYSFQRNLIENGYSEYEVGKLLDRYEKLGTTLIDYDIPSVDISGGSIHEAVEIFSRVNSKGQDISPDWMVSALTYNRDRDFKLGDEITKLLNELEYYNWSNLKRDIVFDCIMNSFGKAYFDQGKRIEKLAKLPEFIEKTRSVFIAIKKAIKFLFEELLIVEDKLLPYNNQLIFITDFFNQVEDPSSIQLEKLKDWFWQTSLTNYFTIYSLSKQRQAYIKFQKFIQGLENNPLYIEGLFQLKVTDWPNKIYFGSARAKAFILFLLNESNSWQKCSVINVNGFELLFIENNDSPYSAVAYLKTDPPSFPKVENIFELEKLQNSYLIHMYNNEKNYNYLAKRQNEIMEVEKLLVDRLGLEYFN